MFQVLSWQHLWDCVFLLCSSQILWKFCLHELNDLNEAILTSPHFRGNSDGNISPPVCKWEAAKSERMNQNANLAMFNFNPSTLKSLIIQPKSSESPIQHLCAKAPLHPRTYRDRPRPHWLCLPDLDPRPAENEGLDHPKSSCLTG